MNYPACLCGANSYRIYTYNQAGNAFAVLSCRQCGLARTWPSPLQNDLVEELYNRLGGHEDKFREMPLRRIFAERALGVLLPHCQTGRLLEVGCSSGIFVDEARQRGFKAEGIDVSAAAISEAQREFPQSSFSIGTLADNKYSENAFDVVAYIHCLEHIPEPIAELREAARVLKPGGWLLIEVPRFFSLWRVLLGCRWYGLVPSQHVWQFGRRGITELLRRAGFKVVAAETRRSLYRQPEYNLKGLIKALISAIAWITKTGDNLFVLARKP